ncbi:MAG: histidine triad protein [Ignavibacteria bacterium]|nr:histidine triad protein [Ignavibacteria bacterium]
METLWAPWRWQYIDGFKDEGSNKEKECFFCKAAENPALKSELLVISQQSLSIVMLNRYPYNNGHLMIAPNRHISALNDATDEELAQIMLTLPKCCKILEAAYSPHGFNIGANIGRSSGAGVPGHLHFHIVPRWNGDTNFMTVFADVKVVSQSLDETQKILSQKFELLSL